MTIPSHFIAVWDASLSPGQSDRMVCPVCAGGQSREASFVVSKQADGSLVWICHRAGCGERGGTTGTVNARPATPRKHAPPPRLTLTQPRLDHFWTKYGIRPYTIESNDVMYDSESSGDYFPIRHWSGKQLGFQLRWPHRIPKCRTYLTSESDFVTMDWKLKWARTKVPYIIVVEDPISRIKLSGLGYNAVCLFGTHFSAQHALEVADRTDRAVLWLDPDAETLACRYTIDYSLVFRRIGPVFSTRDPKDTPDSEITNLLRTQCGIESPCGNSDEDEL